MIFFLKKKKNVIVFVFMSDTHLPQIYIYYAKNGA